MKIHMTVTLSCEFEIDPADFDLDEGQGILDAIKEQAENGGDFDLLDTLSYDGYSVDKILVKEAVDA